MKKNNLISDEDENLPFSKHLIELNEFQNYKKKYKKCIFCTFFSILSLIVIIVLAFSFLLYFTKPKRIAISASYYVDDNQEYIKLIDSSYNSFIDKIKIDEGKIESNYSIKFSYNGVHNVKIILKNENLTSLKGMFSECKELQTINFSEGLINREKIDNMSYLFYKCKRLYEIDFSGQNNYFFPGDIESMFEGCENLTKVNITKFVNTSNAKSVANLFAGCKKLESIDLSGFDFKNISNYSRMFDGCNNLNWINLKGVKFNEMGYCYDNMFNNVNESGILILDSEEKKNIDKISIPKGWEKTDKEN